MRTLIATAVALIGLSSVVPAHAQRDAPTSFDAWGYRQRSSPHPACPPAAALRAALPPESSPLRACAIACREMNERMNRVLACV